MADSCNCGKGTLSCPFRYVKLDGEYYYLRDTTYYDVNEHCHDCDILNAKGNTHHTNCDMEICPACGEQLAFDGKHESVEVFVNLPKGAKLTPAKYDVKYMRGLEEEIRQWQIKKYSKPIGEGTTEE